MGPTLYEDWLARRAKLTEAQAAGEAAYAAARCRVFDYLLERYRGAPEGQLEARFPLRVALKLETRAILVHHHLGPKDRTSVKNAADAHLRVGRILKRMAAQEIQASVKAPACNTAFDELEQFSKSLLAIDQTLADLNTAWLRFLRIPMGEVDLEQSIALFHRLDSYLQRAVLGELYKKIQEPNLPVKVAPLRGGLSLAAPFPIMDFYTRAEHPYAFGYTHLAWRWRVEQRLLDGVLESFEHLFRAPYYRAMAAERMRSEQANASPEIRFRALRLLCELGSFEDIGLLQDLMALPAQHDEYPGERQALFAAMEDLARKTPT
ncbi:MAG: hypothetical protein M5U26_09725 [Planctomycetota bacterium]|nr:hypothetical protein [Planctomycetota bacterium]